MDIGSLGSGLLPFFLQSKQQLHNPWEPYSASGCALTARKPSLSKNLAIPCFADSAPCPMPEPERCPQGTFQASYRDTCSRLKDSYSTPFPITFLAYFCHNGWKTYLRSQFPEQLGWPHDTGRGSKEGYVSLKTKTRHATTKSPSPLVFPFFLHLEHR